MKSIKRDRRGRFKKGGPPGPGRKKKTEIQGVPLSRVKDAFLKVFVEVFNKTGDWRELAEFVKSSNLNKRMFLMELRKLIPPEEEGDFSQDSKPLLVIDRIITDKREDLPMTDMAMLNSGKPEKKKKGKQRETPDEKKPMKETTPSDPEKMSIEQLETGIQELEKKKEALLVDLAEKRPNKSKVVN